MMEKEIKFGNVLCNRKVKVYAKINSDGYVTNIQSDVFLKDTSGWVLIDEGSGDRFVYANMFYFDKPLLDEEGNYQVKFEK